MFVLPLTLLSSLATASELALYWGQSSAGFEDSLGSYCETGSGDIYIISFIDQFGSGLTTSMSVAGQSGPISTLSIPSIGEDIEKCQQLGKKVLISLGGAAGSYGFNSDSNAQEVARELWNAFGGGSGVNRPFGSAKIDGFDLDGENMMYATEYITFINELRTLYTTDTSKQYYTSAAPQCPFPDASTGQAIANAYMDFLFIQFYNNYCNLISSNFNFETWQTFASTQSPNPDVKLYVGLAGSPTAAGSGYATIDEVKEKLPQFSTSPNFAGFMAWDASQANANIVDGETYAQQLVSLGGDSPAASLISATTSTSTSSSSYSVPPRAPTSAESQAISNSQVSSSSTNKFLWWTPETVASPSTTSLSISISSTQTSGTSTQSNSWSSPVWNVKPTDSSTYTQTSADTSPLTIPDWSFSTQSISTESDTSSTSELTYNPQSSSTESTSSNTPEWKPTSTESSSYSFQPATTDSSPLSSEWKPSSTASSILLSTFIESSISSSNFAWQSTSTEPIISGSIQSSTEISTSNTLTSSLQWKPASTEPSSTSSSSKWVPTSTDSNAQSSALTRPSKSSSSQSSELNTYNIEPSTSTEASTSTSEWIPTSTELSAYSISTKSGTPSTEWKPSASTTSTESTSTQANSSPDTISIKEGTSSSVTSTFDVSPTVWTPTNTPVSTTVTYQEMTSDGTIYVYRTSFHTVFTTVW